MDSSDFRHRNVMYSEFSYILKGGVEIPSSVLQPRKNCFAIIAKIDAGHAFDAVAIMSRTGFIFLSKYLTNLLALKEAKNCRIEFIRFRVYCYKVALRAFAWIEVSPSNHENSLRGPYLDA